MRIYDIGLTRVGEYIIVGGLLWYCFSWVFQDEQQIVVLAPAALATMVLPQPAGHIQLTLSQT